MNRPKRVYDDGFVLEAADAPFCSNRILGDNPKVGRLA
jgi:hypothetical protein